MPPGNARPNWPGMLELKPCEIFLSSTGVIGRPRACGQDFCASSFTLIRNDESGRSVDAFVESDHDNGHPVPKVAAAMCSRCAYAWIRQGFRHDFIRTWRRCCPTY
jgi:hypothetical protein